MPKKKKIPKHLIRKETRWRAIANPDKKTWHIRKTVYLKDGTQAQPRMDARLYRDIKDNKQKIDEFLLRENYRIEREKKAKEVWDLKSAFVKNSEVKDDFLEFMVNKTGNESHSRNVVYRLKNHVIDVLHNEKIYDFKDWEKPKSQELIVNSMKKKNLAKKTIKETKNSMNLFFKFLHHHSDGHIPVYKVSFPSLNTQGMRKYEERRKEKLSTKDRRLSGEDYIDGVTFNKILKAAKIEIKGVKPSEQPSRFISCFLLSYYYGLRRSETLSTIDAQDFKKGYLRISKQRVRMNKLAELKWGHTERKVPHYFTNGKLSKSRMKKNNMQIYSLDDVFEWVEQAPVSNPTALTNAWTHLMDQLGLQYTLHNLRNTYISNLFRDMTALDITPVEICKAAGHKDLRTTQKYLRDFRSFDEDVFTPKKGNVLKFKKKQSSENKIKKKEKKYA